MAASYLGRFSIPKLEKCCCFQLKTGGIIIPCIWLIPITLLTGYTGWEMVRTAINRGRVRSDDELANLTERIEFIESMHDSFIVQLAMVEAGTLVILATCLLQIYGAAKEKRVLMIPFMTIWGCGTNIIVCSEIVRIVFGVASIAGIFTSVVAGAIGVYVMLILLNYYRKLQQKPPSTETDDIIETIEGIL